MKEIPLTERKDVKLTYKSTVVYKHTCCIMGHQVNWLCKFNVKLSVNESKRDKCNMQHNELHPNTSDLCMSRLKTIKSWRAEPVSVAKDSEDLCIGVKG